MAIEVEKRALLTEETYKRCIDALKQAGAVDMGENNADTIFYVTPNSQIKVQHAISKKTAKIAWKSGGIDGPAHREEIELAISPADCVPAQTLVERMAPEARKFITAQKRHDFRLRGIVVSLKYSDDWGYHAELDINVEHQGEVGVALEKIMILAESLDLHPLTESEEKEFVAGLIAKY